jgi:hypothetical protein
MEIDVIKLLVLVVLAGILGIARYFSAMPAHDQFRPLPPDPLEEQRTRHVPAVGKEIAFPFDIREFEAQYGPDFKRPSILNYYFTATDLIKGPPDPEAFYDSFSIEFLNEDDNHRWTSEYTIATPQGIDQHMADNRYKAQYGDGMIILRRYDLADILRAVVELHIDTGENKTGISEPRATED